MKHNTLFFTLSLFAAVLALSACNKEEDTLANSGEARTWKVTINASPATETRAISIGGNDGHTLFYNWNNADAVEVVKAGISVGSLSADVSAGNSAYATLDGTLTGTFAVDDAVTLYYHTADLDYTGQVGTLAGVSTSKSYLEATSTVKSVDGSGGFLAMSDAAFSPMQAYLDLTFTGGGNPINVSSLKIWADGGKLVKTKAIDGTTVYATEADPLVVTPATPTSKLFLALRDENGAANNYHFKATAGAYTYAFEDSKNLQYGHYYAGNVAMTITDLSSIPLTFEAKVDGVDVMFGGGTSKTIEYSIDGGANWTSYTPSGMMFEVMTTLANAGDKVLLRGDNESYEDYYFALWEDCYVYGNIMSLIDSDGYSTLTTLTGDHNFVDLFNGQKVFSHPTIPLLLPATTLTDHCYDGMFKDTELSVAPDLPATSLADYCYSGMFYGCTSLTTAPDLPATTLADYCYENMFYDCSSLTTAPDLPATTLADYCYENMFYGCTSLTTVPSILPATTLTDHCYDGMFYGCSILTTAPILPAETLTSFCYACMFNGCTNLTSIVCLAKTKLDSPDWSFYEWDYFGTSGGTLYIHPDLVLNNDPATFSDTLPYPWDWKYDDPGYTTGDPWGVVPHNWTVTKYIPAP